ncbi:type III effector HrpK domain-containing protein [Bradyrhizobium sp. USDA 4353]
MTVQPVTNKPRYDDIPEDQEPVGARAQRFDNVLTSSGRSFVAQLPSTGAPLVPSVKLATTPNAGGALGQSDFETPVDSLLTRGDQIMKDWADTDADPPEVLPGRTAPRVPVHVNNSPNVLPDADKKTLAEWENDPVIRNAIDPEHKGITREKLSNFLSGLRSDINKAGESYNQFLKDHPNADAASKELAHQAASLMAYSRFITGGSNQFTPQNLAAFASSQDKFLPADVRDAARLFSNPAIFAQLDTAGMDPATSKTDGILDFGNITAFMKDSLPSDTAGLGKFLQNAAAQQALAGVDTSKVGPDIFTNPSKYDAKTRAAVLLQLEQAQISLRSGMADGLWDKYGWTISTDANGEPTKFFSGNAASVESQLEARINTLSSDKEVQQYLATAPVSNLQTMLDGDASLKAAVTDEYKDFQSGAMLAADLDQKDKDGKPVSMGDALGNFVAQGNFFSAALGTNGNKLDVDIPGTVQKSSKYNDIVSYYKTNVVTGKDFEDALAKGEDIVTAAGKFGSEIAAFSSVLPASQQDTATLMQNYSDIVSKHLLDSGTAADLKAYTDANGNIDEAKLLNVINLMEQQNPDAFKDEKGNRLSTTQIISYFKQVYDEARNGEKLSQSLDKIFGTKTTNPLTDSYNKGYLHAVSALFAGGILVAKSVKGASSPADIASLTATAANLTGLLMESGSKYAKSAAPARLEGDALKAFEGRMKQIESYGKALGGAGSVIGGVLGLIGGIDMLNHGDKVGGGIAITSGILGLIQGGASITEAVAGLAAAEGIAAGAAVVGSAVGVVAGVLAIVFLFVSGLQQAAKFSHDQTTFYGKLDILAQLGITGSTWRAPVPEPKPHSGPAVT